MTITIPPDWEAEVTALAQASGVSPEKYLQALLEKEIKTRRSAGNPLRSYSGVLAKYGPAPSNEEIDENRREMFRGFAREDEW